MLIQLCSTLCDPMGCGPPGSSVASLMSPAFVDGIFTTGTTWEAHVGGTMSENSKNGSQIQVGHWESKAGLLGGSG